MDAARGPRENGGGGPDTDGAAVSDVTDYVEAIDADLRSIAERLRELVREELPQAEEAIKWRQPTYTLVSACGPGRNQFP